MIEALSCLATTPAEIAALVLAIGNAGTTQQEAALISLLRRLSPRHPLLDTYAELAADSGEEPVERREVTAEMVREHARKAIAREQGAL